MTALHTDVPVHVLFTKHNCLWTETGNDDDDKKQINDCTHSDIKVKHANPSETVSDDDWMDCFWCDGADQIKRLRPKIKETKLVCPDLQLSGRATETSKAHLDRRDVLQSPDTTANK